MHICEEEVIFLAAYFTISVTKMFANKSHLPNASQKELLTKQASVSQTMHENTWKCTIYFGIIRSVGQIKRLRPQSSRTISSNKGKNLFSNSIQFNNLLCQSNQLQLRNKNVNGQPAFICLAENQFVYFVEILHEKLSQDDHTIIRLL